MTTRHERAAYWTHAGRHFAFEDAGAWLCVDPAMAARARHNLGEARWSAEVESKWDAEWGDRETELVFIGIDVDESAARAALDACLADDAEMDAYRESWAAADAKRARLAELMKQPLRFEIGTEVECNLGSDGWQRGTVVAHHYLEEGWDKPAPYQVQLAASSVSPDALIFAPADIDDVVRAARKA